MGISAPDHPNRPWCGHRTPRPLFGSDGHDLSGHRPKPVKSRRSWRSSDPHRPRAVRWHPRGCRRSVGKGAHRPAIEPRKLDSPECRRVRNHGRQHGGRASASVQPTRRGRRPWHVWKLFAREPGDLCGGGQQWPSLPRTAAAALMRRLLWTSRGVQIAYAAPQSARFACARRQPGGRRSAFAQLISR